MDVNQYANLAPRMPECGERDVDGVHDVDAVHRWRRRRQAVERVLSCIDMLSQAELEARLDFDEDLPPLDADALGCQIGALRRQVQVRRSIRA